MLVFGHDRPALATLAVNSMTVTPERITRLQELGLTEYASRAYLALLDLGTSDARRIGTQGKVPMGKVYRALEQLQTKGLVTILPENPKRYSPIPIASFVAKLQREHENKIRSLARERDDLEKEFPIVGTTAVGDKGTFSLVRGRRNAIDAFTSNLAEASQSVTCLVTAGFADRYESYLHNLTAARTKGIHMRFLAPITAQNRDLLTALTDIGEVRHRNLEGGHDATTAIHIFDGRKALVVTLAPDDASLYTGKDVGIFTDQEGVVGALAALADTVWDRAPSYLQRKRELESGQAATFTHLYRSPEETRAALLAAMKTPVKDFLYANTQPQHVPHAEGRRLIETIHRKSTAPRAVMHFPDLETLDAFRRVAGDGFKDYRHLEQGSLSRFWVLDTREAFMSLTRPSATLLWGDPNDPTTQDLVVHTSDPAVIQSLRSHFEELWAAAQPAEARAAAFMDETSVPVAGRNPTKPRDSAGTKTLTPREPK